MAISLANAAAELSLLVFDFSPPATGLSSVLLPGPISDPSYIFPSGLDR